MESVLTILAYLRQGTFEIIIKNLKNNFNKNTILKKVNFIILYIL